MKQNRSFSIMSFLKSNTVTGLCSAVKDTVVSTLADAGSQISDYLEKQKQFSAGKKPATNGMKGKSHEEWKTDAICRSLRNRQ